MADQKREEQQPMPSSVLWVALAWLVVLGAVFVVFELSDALRDALPSRLGKLPMGIVWFGAVGGSLASFTGIFWHNQDWDPAYNVWHYLRPAIGIITGGVGCLLLLGTTELATSKTSVATNPDIYYAAAFVIGFAEAPFRALVKRITDAVFGPGPSNPKRDDGGDGSNSSSGPGGASDPQV